MIINDDSVYEGPESFYVELSSPNYALLGDIGTALVTIIDVEDGKLCLLKMLNVCGSNDLSNNSLKANDYYVCLFGEADSWAFRELASEATDVHSSWFDALVPQHYSPPSLNC